MKKLAIFVEGYTELLFVASLLESIAGARNVLIEQRSIRGGSTTRRTFGLIKAADTATDQKYYVLLVDCGGDTLVKTRIQEEHENLTKQGYQLIIGIRDVRPDFTHADIPKLEVGLRKYIKTSLAPVEFVLSVLEIEAWFLAEHTHFPKIEETITIPAIVAHLGFNPEQDDMSLRLTPTYDLDACYAIGGKQYSKGDEHLTVAALDYEEVYLTLPNKIPQVARLVTFLDSFLTPPATE